MANSTPTLAPPPPPQKKGPVILTGDFDSWDDNIDLDQMAKRFGRTNDGRQLPDYPPRNGPDGKPMDQVWIRTRLGGETDVDNLQRIRDRGWRPRPPDTLPGYTPVMMPGIERPVIGVSGMVLFERPHTLGVADRDAIMRERNAQLDAVRDQMGRKVSHGGSEYGRLRVDELKSNVRRPEIQPDDE